MEDAIKEKVTTFKLPNKKLLVVPIKRKGGWLPPGHEAEFLFKTSTVDLPLPRDRHTGQYKEPLSTEERAFFESDAAGLALKKNDLNVHNKADNYWDNFKVKLDKNTKVLDLSKPMDYLQYKVLLQNTSTVAPSADQKLKKGTYRFCITEEGHENEQKVKAASSKMEAYKFLGKVEHSAEKMRDFLNVYNTIRPGGKQVAPNAKAGFCIAEMERLIIQDLSGFLDLVRDEQYTAKVLVHNALAARALIRDGMVFKTADNKTVIGETMGSVLDFLANPKNSEEVIKIKGRIENSK